MNPSFQVLSQCPGRKELHPNMVKACCAKILQLQAELRAVTVSLHFHQMKNLLPAYLSYFGTFSATWVLKTNINRALLALVRSLSPCCVLLMPPRNILLCNSRDFSVGAAIVVQCAEICLRTSALELPVVKKFLTFPSHCCLRIAAAMETWATAAGTWWVTACVSPSVRGRNFGRGEAKAPVEQPNLLQPHERGERTAVWLQGYWGIAERERAFETFLLARCICSCEKLGGLLNGVIREETPSEPVRAQISVLRIKILFSE